MLFNLSQGTDAVCNYLGQPICSNLSKIGSEVISGQIPIALATIAAIGTAFLVYRKWNAADLNAVAPAAQPAAQNNPSNPVAPHTKLNNSQQPTHLEFPGYSVPKDVVTQHILTKLSPMNPYTVSNLSNSSHLPTITGGNFSLVQKALTNSPLAALKELIFQLGSRGIPDIENSV